MGNGPGALIQVIVGDDPVDWTSIGFALDDEGRGQVGAVGIRCVGAGDARGRGIVGWVVAGCTVDGDDIDGLATTTVPPPGVPRADVVAEQPIRHTEPGAEPEPGAQPADAEPGAQPAAAEPGARPGPDRGAVPGPTPGHPNGVTRIDHLVVTTPDLDRTTAALEAAGLPARRTREAGHGRRQRFFRLGEVIIELVGPVEPAGDGPATFWGFAFTVADLDATAGRLVGRIGEPRPAVQAGRRIATLRRSDEVSVPVAFMSPPPPVTSGGSGDTPR
jgi:hypothetical protein